MIHRQNAAGSPIVGLAGGKLKKTRYMEPRPEEAPAEVSTVGPASHQLLHGDCLELLLAVPDASVDLVLADLPYDQTSQKWDVIIPMERLWPHLLRVLRPGGKVVLTATNPFAAYLITSAPKACPFKYEWVWVKNGPTNFVNAKKMPMRKHELVLVFQRETGTYNPQGLVRCQSTVKNSKSKMQDMSGGILNGQSVPFGRVLRADRDVPEDGFQLGCQKKGKVINKATHNGSGKDANDISGWGEVRGDKEYYVQEFTNYPVDILEFPRDHQMKHRLHPTQKPVTLFEYLIRTYTDEGGTVLDVTAGSFTTTIAAMRCGRSSVGMEMDERFFGRGKARYEAELAGGQIKN